MPDHDPKSTAILTSPDPQLEITHMPTETETSTDWREARRSYNIVRFLRHWIWDWAEGGYNTCSAATRKQATAKAVELGTPELGTPELGTPVPGGMTVTLTPINVRETNDAEVERYRRRFYMD